MQALYFASWVPARDIPLALGAGATNAIWGWTLGVFIMAITKLFMTKFGHGDTKLVAAVGSILGPGPVLMVYFYYSICFGIFSFFKLASTLPWLHIFVSMEMKKAGAAAAPVDVEKLNAARKEIIPVAPFIALGTICTLLFEKQTMAFFGFTEP